jgi:hypothetical protein
MAEPRWLVLRQRLLNGGVSPWRVRRLLGELRTHYGELVAEARHSGADRATAQAIALQRLGSEADLANRMLAQRNLLSWSHRWPWAVYGIGAPLLFGTAFVAACVVLTAMSRLLHGMEQPAALRLLSVMRTISLLMLYALPVATAAAVAMLAFRRRVRLAWALCAVMLVCLLGAMTNVEVSLRSVGAGVGFSTGRLAGLLLRRWVPTVLSAMVLATLAHRAARVLKRHGESGSAQELSQP